MLNHRVAILGLVFACAACSRNAKPAEPPVATTTPTPAPAAVASPNLAVSKDLASQCNLQFGSTDKAPKFDFDKADLSTEDRSLLDRVATCVTTGPLKGRSLRLVGHTDARGEPEYNLSLGDHRAGAAKDYLTRLGVAPGHLGETSRGELDASGKDEAGFGRDRRVDILLQ